MSCAAMKKGTEAMAIPEKLSVRERPSVIAGLTKLVEDVNTYALPIHAGTNQKTWWPLPWLLAMKIVAINPAVATI